jgi:hypothetical protein
MERARCRGTVTVVPVAVVALGVSVPGKVLFGQPVDGAGENDVTSSDAPPGLDEAAAASGAADGPGTGAGAGAGAGPGAPAGPAGAAMPTTDSGSGGPTARVTAQCLGDQTNRLQVEGQNLDGENLTVVFDSTNDTADFTTTVRPDANGSVAEEFDVSDEYNLTVTAYLGNGTNDPVLDSERFESGTCDVFDARPPVEAARLETDCVDGQGVLTLENRNDGADIEVVVTAANGTEVLNTTLEAASTEVLDGLSNGTYTVVSTFGGEGLETEQVEVSRPAS